MEKLVSFLFVVFSQQLLKMMNLKKTVLIQKKENLKLISLFYSKIKRRNLENQKKASFQLNKMIFSFFRSSKKLLGLEIKNKAENVIKSFFRKMTVSARLNIQVNLFSSNCILIR